MAEIVQFTIGAKASCTDGTCGEVTRVIVDPVAEAVTHLVVEPEHRRGLGRLVPIGLVVAAAGQIRLRCTKAEFEKLEPAEETRFIPGTSGYAGYGPGEVGYWPYYGVGMTAGLGLEGGISAGLGGIGGGITSELETSDTVPLGQGLVIDRGSGHVTHVLLQEGHLWGRKEVAIPIGAVTSTSGGIRLRISKQEVQDLPPVDVGHPGAGAGGR
jgi:hypothetical protein